MFGSNMNIFDSLIESLDHFDKEPIRKCFIHTNLIHIFIICIKWHFENEVISDWNDSSENERIWEGTFKRLNKKVLILRSATIKSAYDITSGVVNNIIT